MFAHHKRKGHKNKITTPATEINAPINSIGAMRLPFIMAGTINNTGVKAIKAEAIPVSVLVIAYKESPTPSPGPKKEPIEICFKDFVSFIAFTKAGPLFK